MKLTQKDWTTLSELLDEALDLPAEARAAWVEGLAESFANLKPTLRELFTHEATAQTDDFLAALPRFTSLGEDKFLPSAAQFEEGAVVGPYRLLRELGQGGMGAVWLAERTDGVLKRTVALKLPLLSVHNKALAERFVRERDILAQLVHPNIARLYDAGVTSTGQPFLALEFVEGVLLTEYCDVQRLPVRSRIDLFLQVVAAVQYAHGNLVVHRDLKPSNILVTAQAQVRLLDFGIAKLLLEGEAKETELTQVGGRALTPDYASPEQILGQAVTTASDVYSLGVVLYELLCGHRPYRLKRDSRAALEEAILAADPVMPSHAAFTDAIAQARSTTTRKLPQALAGDLDTIVLKALKKNAAERYATADAFAQDIERYLKGEVVLARPDSAWYRTRKFLWRNKVAAIATAAVFVALAAGLGVALWQARIARTEARTAEAVQTFLLDIFSANTDAQADPLKARETTARELLDIGARRVSGNLQAVPETQQVVLDTLASMYFELGMDEEAASMQLQRVNVLKRSYGPHHPKVAEALLDYSRDLSATTKRSQMVPALEEARAILDTAKDFSSVTRGELLLGLARAYAYVSIDRMLFNANEAVRFYRRYYPADDNITAALFYAGRARSLLGQCRAAESLYLESLAEAKNRAQRAFSTVIADLVWLGDTRAMCEEIVSAEETLRTAVASSQQRNGKAHVNTIFAEASLAHFLHSTSRREESWRLFSGLQEKIRDGGISAPNAVGQFYKGIAASLLAEGRLEAANEFIEKSVEADKQFYPASTLLAGDLLARAELATARGRYVEADKLLVESIDTWRTAVGPTATPMVANRFHLARMRLLLAEGDALTAQAIRRLIVVPPDAEPLPLRLDETKARIMLAGAYLQQGRSADALKEALDALGHIQRSPVRDYYQTLEAGASLVLGQAQARAGDPNAARINLQRALELREANDDKVSPWLAEAEIALADCLITLGERTQAYALLAQAKAIHATHKELGEHLRRPLGDLERRLAQEH